jgi:hypothetical protein
LRPTSRGHTFFSMLNKKQKAIHMQIKCVYHLDPVIVPPLSPVLCVYYVVCIQIKGVSLNLLTRLSFQHLSRVQTASFLAQKNVAFQKFWVSRARLGQVSSQAKNFGQKWIHAQLRCQC